MRWVLLVAVVLVASAGALSGTAAAASCPGGFDADGTRGTFYKKISARGMDCVAARSVVRSWIRHQNKTDGADPTARVTITRLRCTGRVVTVEGRKRAGIAVRCAGPKSAVSFLGSR